MEQNKINNKTLTNHKLAYLWLTLLQSRGHWAYRSSRSGSISPSLSQIVWSLMRYLCMSPRRFLLSGFVRARCTARASCALSALASIFRISSLGWYTAQLAFDLISFIGWNFQPALHPPLLGCWEPPRSGSSKIRKGHWIIVVPWN